MNNREKGISRGTQVHRFALPVQRREQHVTFARLSY